MKVQIKFTFSLIPVILFFGLITFNIEQANAAGFSASIPTPAEPNATLEILGSFEYQELLSTGKLDLIIDLNPDTATYKEIIFKTLPETYVFSGEFAGGFNGELIPVMLELTYEIIFRTNRPSNELAITPIQGGGYTIENFFTSHCDFRCWDFLIEGSWSATGPTETKSGSFSEILDGRYNRGIGAGTESDLDPSGFPNTSTLVNFGWSANTGGILLPRLVEVSIDGALIIIDAHRARAFLIPADIPSLLLEPKVPAAVFNASKFTGNAPLNVNFYDESIGEIDSWQWDFGDGTGSSLPNTNHTFINPGSYSVSLTVTGPEGTDTKERTNYILVTESPSPPPPPKDSDGDGVIDTEDNCISIPNPGQADSDQDKVGDACDIDNLQSTIQELNDMVNQLSQQNELIQSQMENLIDSYDAIDQKMQELESDVTGLKAFDAGLQQTLDEINGMVRDHSHVYKTGSGKGHNNKEVDTGPPNFR